MKKLVLLIFTLPMLLLALTACSSDENVPQNNSDISSQAQEEQNTAQTPYVSPIDFEASKAENADIYAWIRIPNTNVDYPILQSAESDEYYLRKNLQGEYDIGGSLFTQGTFNRQTFDDPHTVIYGHNMAGYGDTMFTDVRKYDNQEFFDAHRDIYIYTPEKELHYKVFAAYTWNDEHLLYTYQCRVPEMFQNYLDSIFVNRDLSAIIDKSITLTSDNKILTLSTCEANTASAYRFLVQAVLQ